MMIAWRIVALLGMVSVLHGCIFFDGPGLRWDRRIGKVIPGMAADDVVREVGNPTAKFKTLREWVESHPNVMVASVFAPGTPGGHLIPYREYLGREVYAFVHGHTTYKAFDYSSNWLDSGEFQFDELWEYDAAVVFENPEVYLKTHTRLVAIRNGRVAAVFTYCPSREFTEEGREKCLDVVP